MQPSPHESGSKPDSQPQPPVQPVQVIVAVPAAPAAPSRTWNTANQKPIKSLAEVMREQEEEEARRRQAAAEQAQEDMANSGFDLRGGVWSSKSAAAPVPLKEIMMQQQKAPAAADATGAGKSSDAKSVQEASKPAAQAQQLLSLKEIQAEQLRIAEQEKQARAQQKASAAVVHVPVAVIAPKEAPKTPVSSKGKQAEVSKSSSGAGVWGAPAAAPSLKDIQAEQLRQAELQKEQQRAQQQAQRASASPSFSTVASPTAASQPPSLKEIQAEQLRSLQSSQRVVAAAAASLPAPAVPAAAPSSAPQVAAKISSPAPAASSAPKKSQGSAALAPAPASAPPSIAAVAADDDDMVWDYSAKPVTKAQSRSSVFALPLPIIYSLLTCRLQL